MSAQSHQPPRLARDALGLGLRRAHYGELFARLRAFDEHAPSEVEHDSPIVLPGVDYFEIITENFFGDAEPPRQRLDRVREHFPIVLHGVGLNLLGDRDPDPAYLDRVAALADHVAAPFVSDHLCWTGAHGISHHDLLPSPYTDDLVELAARRAAFVQNRLGRPFGLENLSSYVTFERSTMSEVDFYRKVVDEARCHFMLDVNNVYVSSENHGFDPEEYVARVDFTRVLQVHVAGHSREASGLIIDTHDHPVSDAVWALYRHAWQLGGPFPTLLEWDDRIPPLDEALAELDKAREARA